MSYNLLKHGKVKTLAEGEDLKLQSLQNAGSYFLEAGEGYTYLNGPEGHRQNMRLFTRPSLFFSNGSERFHALSDCRLVELTSDNLEMVIVEEPALAAEVVRLLRESIDDMALATSLIGASSALQSVAGFIAYLGEIYDVAENEGFHTKLSRSEIGDLLGLTFETVSRKISYLNRQNVIAVQGSYIEIRDKKALRDHMLVKMAVT